ncbi:MAG: hypothetical protein DID92_2727744205 [Candidatus Nitrotoga sp. SPKER]|nr:MAG: hypothetical protein DID92_2727744205 [Candidatus Nitrotoga sp. SPKER]
MKTPPLFTELSLANKSDTAPSKTASKFSGTNNPRHLRVIAALMTRSQKREHIDRIAGASNGPELIAELRRRGLDAPCSRVPAIDRDGYPVRFGVYDFTDGDRRKVHAWLRQRGAA